MVFVEVTRNDSTEHYDAVVVRTFLIDELRRSRHFDTVTARSLRDRHPEGLGIRVVIGEVREERERWRRAIGLDHGPRLVAQVDLLDMKTLRRLQTCQITGTEHLETEPLFRERALAELAAAIARRILSPD